MIKTVCLADGLYRFLMSWNAEKLWATVFSYAAVCEKIFVHIWFACVILFSYYDKYKFKSFVWIVILEYISAGSLIRQHAGCLLLRREQARRIEDVRKGDKGKSQMNYTYMVKCQDGSLYTGWTNHLEKRVQDHNAGKGAKYTKSRRPVTLVYYETYQTKEEAMKRECAIKKMKRKEKLKLVQHSQAVVI